MHHIQGCDREQTLLLPNSVDDYIGPDNPVRFVEQLDLQEAGFCRVEPEETGRPGYHPGDLLKLYIYGYLNRVRSSRRLEAETRRNLEVMWLLRGLTPDFKTIADFRKDNRGAFKPVFRQFALLCRKLELFGGELLAVDGTRLKAVNSTERNFTHAKLTKQIESIDQKLADYLQSLDRCDAQEATAPSTARAKRLSEKIATLRTQQTRCHTILQELERTGESQISLTDPDSRAMALHPKVGVGYNAQVAVDSKHKLIVEQEVTNAGTDLGLLAPTAAAAKEVLGADQIKVVADSGYYKGEDIAACEAAGIEAYVPRPQRGFAVREGLFRKEEFHYDAQNDVYICPGSQQLHRRYRSSGGEHDRIYYCNRDACRHCELKSRCTTNPYRQVVRWIDEAVLDRMETRLKANPHIPRQRRELVEHPFGSIKQWMNQGAFLMRGLEKVRAEFSLTALAYNMTRVLTIVGIERLLKVFKNAKNPVLSTLFSIFTGLTVKPHSFAANLCQYRIHYYIVLCGSCRD
jgi:transposase